MYIALSNEIFCINTSSMSVIIIHIHVVVDVL